MTTSRAIRRKSAKRKTHLNLSEALRGIEQYRQVLAVAHAIIGQLAGESASDLLELVDSVIKGEANLRAHKGETLPMSEVNTLVKQTVAHVMASIAARGEEDEVDNG